MASFLDLFTATDSDGARAARYQLNYIGSYLSNQDSWVFGMCTAVVYALFKVVAVIANGLLGLVMSSASWLDPLSEAYQTLMSPIYNTVPPWAIACLGLGIVGVSVLWSRPTTTTGGVFDSPSLNRIGVALAMVMMVVILTHDPFALVTKTMELANGFAVSISAAATGNANDTTISAGSALVDNSLRTPTIALNYGTTFNDACATAWSQAMAAGTELPAASGCFEEDQNRAGPDSLLTALFMLLFPAIPMLVFAVVGAWKYIVHLSLAVLMVVATAWVAAINVHKRRGFESLADTFARAAGHLTMAVLTSMLAVGLPSLVSGMAIEILGWFNTDAPTQPFALMIGLGVGFAVSSWAILRLTANTGALVRLLKADANTSLEKTLGSGAGPGWATKFAAAKKAPAVPGAGGRPAGAAAAAPPAAAAAPAPAPRPASASGEKGNDPVRISDAVSTDDAEAVTELAKPAVSVAAAAQNRRAEPTGVTVTVAAPDTNTPSSRAWQQTVGAPTVGGVSVIDVFGHYPPVPAPDTGVAGVGVSDGDGPSGVSPAAPTDQRGSDGGDVDASGVLPGDAAQRSPLAAVVVAPLGSPGASVPVPGNVFADPALDAAARSAGATFTAHGERPVATRSVIPLLRRFRDTDPMDPVPFSVAAIEHGPALTLLGEQQNSDDPAQATAGDPVNDQQGWSRATIAARMRRAIARGPVTSSTTETTTPLLPISGIGPGVNRNPASFQAPMPDFLASAALESDIETVGLTLTAAGRLAQVAMPVHDSRLELRLSSDPDHRVVRAMGTGFGDPA